MINILGLSVSMAIFILIVRYIDNQLSTDKFHENLDRIYRVEYVDFSSACSAGIKDILLQNFPEVLTAVRYFPANGIQLEYEESGRSETRKRLRFDNFLWADSTFFDVFTFPLVDGNAASCLSQPYNIVLSESSARKLFGDKDPMGKILKLNNRFTCKVTGIMKDSPGASSIDVNGFISLVSFEEIRGPEFLQNLNNWFYATYVLFPDDHNADTVASRFGAYFTDNFTDNRSVSFHFMPYQDIYFNRINASADYHNHGNMQNVRIFLAIAIFIIIIAIINFINITTATASARAREVGIRKVSGAYKTKLIRQFLGETIVVSLIAVIIAVMITELVKPEFNTIIGEKLNIGYLEHPVIFLYLFAGAVLVGTIAGLYPAFYLTAFKPIQVLKGQVVRGGRGILLRRILIVLQFVISIVLIIGTLVVRQQLDYLRKKDLGFDSEHILFVDVNRDIKGNKQAFREILLQNPNIKNITFSTFKPGDMGGETYRRNINGEDYQFYYTMTDPEFIDVFDLEIVEGRNFHRNSQADHDRAILLNETAVEFFGLEEPVGTQFYLFDTIGTVVGVVKDYHFRSLHNSIEPLSILCIPDWMRDCQIRIEGRNIPETISYIEKIFYEYAPDFTFDYNFMDSAFDDLYKSEEKFGKIFTYFALLAIIIACLGLYGLVSQTAVQRTREICIRKVNGASTSGIVFMLVKELSIWVLIAFIIACPVAWFTMDKWLENFAFQTNIGWWLFLISGVIAFAIAILTMSYKAIRAATMNPGDGLRYE